MNITVVGAGYVGLSLAVLFAQTHDVEVVDIIKDKVDLINEGQSPFEDAYIDSYLGANQSKLRATLDLKSAVKNAEYIIIATPTDYDDTANYFDTRSIEDVIRTVIEVNPQAMIVIKSTIPVGYVEQVRRLFQFDNIIFSPEFLREGHAVEDNLYPSRIIVGDKGERGQVFAHLLQSVALNKDVPVCFMDPREAEAVKLFANTYLAMRVTFFNELDSFAERRGLNTRAIIDGVSLDPRIGQHYHNPSFGYGGYCLPKDSKQLLANYKDVPNNLIRAVVEGNQTRKRHIVEMINKNHVKTIGIYRLIMKKDSHNIRDSIMLDLIDMLEKNHHIIIYEPLLNQKMIKGHLVENDLTSFKSQCQLIIANRIDASLNDVIDKVYTRDIFQEN